jgi:hypothetical protein
MSKKIDTCALGVLTNHPPSHKNMFNNSNIEEFRPRVSRDPLKQGDLTPSVSSN